MVLSAVPNLRHRKCSIVLFVHVKKVTGSSALVGEAEIYTFITGALYTAVSVIVPCTKHNAPNHWG